MTFSPVRKSKRQCAKCEGDLHHSNKSGYCRNCWSIRSLTQALKPNPDYRRRRLAHLPPERVRRYWENVEALRG